MAQSASCWLRQLLRMRNSVTTVTSIPKRNVVTAHSLPLLKSGYDPESPDVVYGSRKWRWLRPASPVESDLDDWNIHRSRLGVAYLTVNADREIPEDIWKKMLKHLGNQMPCLRNVVLPYNNEKWICQVDDIEIPLEMYENVRSEDLIETMFDDPFENGPWACKVLKAHPDDPCPIPEDKESKPNQYNWHFVNHHGLMDGYSNALMIRIALNILNALLAGKRIDDRVQLVHARRAEEVISKRIKLKESLKNNPRWFQKEKERMLSTFKSPLLNEAFPAPNVSTPRTARILRSGDDLTLNAFQKQCKLAGVSVTNGLVALINTAIVEMVREAGIERESYHLTLNTNVDTRRYMNIHPQTATGMLVAGMHQSMHPTKNVREELWEHAKIIGDDSKALLKSDGALIESIIREMSIAKTDADVIFNSSNAPTMTRDYSINNLKDLTSVMYDPKRQKHAVMSNAIITSSLHNFNPMMFSLSSYRGITNLSLEYGTNVISQETAEDLMERVVLLIREKSKIKLYNKIL